MTDPSPPKSRLDFEIAVICALRLEADAVEALFDKFWDDDGDKYGKAPGDTNAYCGGVERTQQAEVKCVELPEDLSYENSDLFILRLVSHDYVT